MGVRIDELELGEVTAAEFLIELRRIADALQKPELCRERKGAAECTLSSFHSGYHVTADGKVHWLDE